MKIKDYEKITDISNDDLFIVETENGTRTIRYGDMSNGANSPSGDVNNQANIQTKRAIYRGKNLGSVITPAQHAALESGTFDDLFLGDYWEFATNKWRIMDFDYWYGFGNTPCTTHHVVIMPDEILEMRPMENNSADATNGYLGSSLRNWLRNLVFENVMDNITSVEFTHNIITYNDYLSSAASDDVGKRGEWVTDCKYEIPNEFMIFGTHIIGRHTIFDHTISNRQLAAIRLMPSLIIPSRQPYWLRDVTSGRTDSFSSVAASGCATWNAANSQTIGLRLVFGLSGGAIVTGGGEDFDIIM